MSLYPLIDNELVKSVAMQIMSDPHVVSTVQGLIIHGVNAVIAFITPYVLHALAILAISIPYILLAAFIAAVAYWIIKKLELA